jgi:succinate dehydrogenase / fumarate reductase cytochrome b subunit
MTVSITAAAGGQTSVGKKIAVATTGIIGVGFVFAHMVGNLKVFLGREQVNHYGEFLRDMGEPIFPRSMVLWGMRLVLIAAVVIHITLTAQLALQSRRARPVRYQHTKPVRAGAANAAARTMRWGGIAILLFLIFHLADFTWGTINPGFERGDVYRNLVASFQRVPVTVVYLAALFALGMHLYHGTWSVCQTLGVNQSRWDKTIRRGATLLAVVIAGGYAIVPLSVVFGLVD